MLIFSTAFRAGNVSAFASNHLVDISRGYAKRWGMLENGEVNRGGGIALRVVVLLFAVGLVVAFVAFRHGLANGRGVFVPGTKSGLVVPGSGDVGEEEPVVSEGSNAPFMPSTKRGVVLPDVSILPPSTLEDLGIDETEVLEDPFGEPGAAGEDVSEGEESDEGEGGASVFSPGSKSGPIFPGIRVRSRDADSSP